MPRKPLSSSIKMGFIVEKSEDQKITIKSVSKLDDLRILKKKMLEILEEIPETSSIAGFVQSTDWFNNLNKNNLQKRKKNNG